jgi:hypothetical protein
VDASLKCGADVNLESHSGWTALHLAAKYGKLDVMKVAPSSPPYLSSLLPPVLYLFCCMAREKSWNMVTAGGLIFHTYYKVSLPSPLLISLPSSLHSSLFPLSLSPLSLVTYFPSRQVERQHADLHRCTSLRSTTFLFSACFNFCLFVFL